jgi:hypothetical protein
MTYFTFTTNYEPKSRSRRTGDQVDEKIVPAGSPPEGPGEGVRLEIYLAFATARNPIVYPDSLKSRENLANGARKIDSLVEGGQL